MSTEIKSAIYGEAEAGRSAKVREYLENVRQTLGTIQYDLAEMLAEATKHNYFREWGFPSRAAFVQECLNIKDREVQYLVNVINRSKQMGYHRTDLENIDISKLKQIFTLNPDGFWLNPETQENEKLSDHIQRLIVIAPSTGLEAILAEVRRLKGLVGDNDLTWTNFQTTRLTKENVILPGLEAWRKYLGSKNVQEKEGSTEYSDGFCLEMLLAEVLSGAVHEEQGQDLIDEVEVMPEGSEEEYAEAA